MKIRLKRAWSTYAVGSEVILDNEPLAQKLVQRGTAEEVVEPAPAPAPAPPPVETATAKPAPAKAVLSRGKAKT